MDGARDDAVASNVACNFITKPDNLLENAFLLAVHFSDIYTWKG